MSTKTRITNLIVACSCVTAVLLAARHSARADDPPQFNRDIQPILADHCLACHGPDGQARQAGLRLDRSESAFAAAESGAVAIVPGDPGRSELVARILSDDPDLQMPPAEADKPLSAEQKQTLQRWIEEGAEYEAHWALIPPVRSTLPTVSDKDWGRNETDAFILARLERESLQPSPPAELPILIRRLSLDLTGLPPAPAEVAAFVEEMSEAGESTDATYRRWVDRFLDSPHYGERMAVDWLDAARFADTNGYQVDRDRDMSAWRDWVINAFNANLPFDQFTIEQIAGDLLPDATLEQRIATGFNRNHMLNEEGGVIPEEFLVEYCADRVETTAAVWLGQTFTCARCHDHKFDDFTQRDYYGLFAFFHNVTEKGIGDYGKHFRRSSPPFLVLATPEQEAALADLREEEAVARDALAKLDEELLENQPAWEEQLREQVTTAAVVEQTSAAKSESEAAEVPEEIALILDKPPADRTDDEQKQLREHHQSTNAERKAQADALAELTKQVKEAEGAIPTALVMEEMPESRETHILMRGDYSRPGEAVTANTPAVLPPMSSESPRNRLGLARWLVDPQNPLPARVTVNRLWQSLFGAGLVQTSEDFGTQGAPPTHPELLDWLAVEFVDSGWNIKHMLRLMVTSATYRQSSRVTPELMERDPQNRLLARGPRFRLQAEFLRDQALAVSGLLVPTIGGPSVKPYHPPGLYEQVTAGSSTNTYEAGHGADLYRRSLYTYWKRSVPHPAMLAFDAPFRETCTLRRPRTNTPLQALNLMNDPTYVEAARFLAGRMLTESGDDVNQQLDYGFRLVLARSPQPQELSLLANAFERSAREFESDPSAAEQLLSVGENRSVEDLPLARLAAMTVVATTLLNLDETVTRE